MNFRIRGLRAETFRPLFALSDAELTAHAAIRVVADRQPGFPCRVSLADAAPGETLLLLNYEHLAVASPYRSRHAIYVREVAEDVELQLNEVPDVLRTRLLSVRAFDAAGMMRDAEVTDGGMLAELARKMLRAPQCTYLHLHNARPGCFAARVDRA